MAKVLRYGLRILAAIFLLWVILMGVAYVYVTTHKVVLTAKVNAFLNSRFQGDIHIGRIGVNLWSNFPYPALQLSDVTMDDSIYARGGQHTVYLERVLIIPGFQGILQGKPIIRQLILENGSFFLYRNSSGYSNGYVWTSRRTAPNAPSTVDAPPPLPLQIRLDNIDLDIADSLRHKWYSFGVHRLHMVQEAPFQWHTTLDVAVRSLSFSTQKGSFLKDQAVTGSGSVAFDPDKEALSFQHMALRIHGQEVTADGDFHFDSTQLFSLYIEAPSLDFYIGRSWLPRRTGRVLDSLGFERPITLDAHIDGLLSNGPDPRILVHWRVAHNTVSGYIGTVNDCSFSGFFINHVVNRLPPSDFNSMVRGDSITGVYENNIAFKTKRLEIVRLDTPVLTFDLSVHNDIAPWERLLGSDDISFDKGKVDMELTCKYPLTDSTGVLPVMHGSIRISDAEITYLPRQVKVTHGQVQLALDRQDVIIRRFSGNIAKNQLTITGSAQHLLTLAAMDTAKMVLDWKVYSPSLDVSVLLPFLGKGGGNTAIHPSNDRSSGTAGKLLDGFIKRCLIKTRLDIDRLTYDEFVATQVAGDLVLDKGVFTLSDLTLHAAKGDIAVSGGLRPYGDDNKVNLSANFKGVDLPSLFYAFDDFGQASLGYKNLSGVLDAQADCSLLLTDKGKKIPGSLDGSLKFSIGQGALLNFSPLSKLDNIAFKNRDFSHVYFSRLYDTFGFTGDTVTFNKMEVQSSVLEMFVEGVYKLDGTYTDAQIQVPFSNLKKPKGVPENVDPSSGHGLSVYVHAFNTGNEPLHYKYGLVKKKVGGIKN